MRDSLVREYEGICREVILSSRLTEREQLNPLTVKARPSLRRAGQGRAGLLPVRGHPLFDLVRGVYFP
jgi:hypothetical protein